MSNNKSLLENTTKFEWLKQTPQAWLCCISPSGWEHSEDVEAFMSNLSSTPEACKAFSESRAPRNLSTVNLRSTTTAFNIPVPSLTKMVTDWSPSPPSSMPCYRIGQETGINRSLLPSSALTSCPKSPALFWHHTVQISVLAKASHPSLHPPARQTAEALVVQRSQLKTLL